MRRFCADLEKVQIIVNFEAIEVLSMTEDRQNKQTNKTKQTNILFYMQTRIQ